MLYPYEASQGTDSSPTRWNLNFSQLAVLNFILEYFYEAEALLSLHSY